MLRQFANPNRCISKVGNNISQGFVQLKVKDSSAGELSIIHRHDKTLRNQQELNKYKEEGYLEEGRLKIIQSDLKRARDSNSVKDHAIMTEHMKQHERRIRKNQENMLTVDPKNVHKIKLERILPKQESIGAFKSQTRMELQDYEAREAMGKPHPSAYRPRHDLVLTQQARPASLIHLHDNAGKRMKNKIFEKNALQLCNRLATKIDRGHEIGEMRLKHVESVLDTKKSTSTF